MRILPRHMQKIVDRIAELREKAPEWLDMLCAVIKVDELNMALKRNQNYIMKMVMEKYEEIASFIKTTEQER